MDYRAVEDRSERAAAPIWPHRVLQAGQRFFHPLARRQLAADLHARLTDPENSSARVGQGNARDQKVRAAMAWIERSAKRAHEFLPPLALEQRHLSAAAAANALLESLAGHERRFVDRIHRSTMRALHIDRFETSAGGRSM